MVSLGRYCGKLVFSLELKSLNWNSPLLETACSSQPLFCEAPLANARTLAVTSMFSQQISWPMPSAQLLAAESGTEPWPSAVARMSVPGPCAPGGLRSGPVPVEFQVEPISVQLLSTRDALKTASGPKALYSESVAELMVAPSG